MVMGWGGGAEGQVPPPRAEPARSLEGLPVPRKQGGEREEEDGIPHSQGPSLSFALLLASWGSWGRWKAPDVGVLGWGGGERKPGGAGAGQ